MLFRYIDYYLKQYLCRVAHKTDYSEVSSIYLSLVCRLYGYTMCGDRRNAIEENPSIERPMEKSSGGENLSR